MGCAPLGHVLFDEFLRFNPKNPAWFDRDRFVLSAGHECMLQMDILEGSIAVRGRGKTKGSGFLLKMMN
ncbi:hypothetical protein ZEAMMB73_Zm00001d016309 [Zea mays]|uniref:Transketolase N-terminal domain-containing protein n=1 Tax=Zea mays TaxID=4577 RepID=A0A1D6H6P6_MAIZE|nr:hypothetical protein ZEAMMB73_Zm00001d016309 [Zea mays]